MSILSAIRKQENPDGLEGHKERLRMLKESKDELPKRVFTRGKNFHKYTPSDIKRPFVYKALAIFATQFCRELCCNQNCPLRGV
jgi:hypothetical protein